MSPPARDRETEATRNTVTRFNEAFNRHDMDGVMALMTEDCLFDSSRKALLRERLGERWTRRIAHFIEVGEGKKPSSVTLASGLPRLQYCFRLLN